MPLGRGRVGQSQIDHLHVGGARDFANLEVKYNEILQHIILDKLIFRFETRYDNLTAKLFKAMSFAFSATLCPSGAIR